MGMIDIILLVLTVIVCVSGGYVAIKSIIESRNKSIKQFNKDREKRRKELKNE